MPKYTGLLAHHPEAHTTKLFHRLHDGDWVHETIQDCTEIAETNQVRRNHVDPWNADKSLRHDACIPLIYREKWIKDYGVDFLNNDPDVQRRVDKILDDPEWRWMRTSNARLA